MKNKNNKLRVVSLFSGIGGFELGLENSQLKGDTIFSSEIDRLYRTKQTFQMCTKQVI